jgi:hypothetical protein
MSKSDPFGFDMSVSSAKKKNPRGKRGLTGGSETSIQACQHEGCREAGKFELQSHQMYSTNSIGFAKTMFENTI